MRGRSVFFSCAGIAISATAAACFASLSDLSGGTPDGGDAAITTTDAASDGAPLGFCASHPSATFCADFDDPSSASFPGWSSEEVRLGTLDFDPTEFTSAPRSFAPRIGAGSGNATARLVLDLSKTAKRTRVSFDFRSSAPTLSDSSDYLSIAELACSTDGTVDGAWLLWKPSGSGAALMLVTNDGTTNTPLVGVREDWMNVQLDATWGSSSHVVVTIDGVTAATADMPTSCTTYDAFFLNLGISFVGTPAVDTVAHYDDVLYELDPP